MPKTNGRPPFGYKNGLNGYYEIAEPAATVIRRIFDEYLKQTSIRQITRRLNEEGIKSSRGVNWDHSIVAYILKNKKYCGSENYKGIISEDIFLKVQELREKGFEKFKVPKEKEEVWKHIYPFTAIIICGKCGEKFTRAVNSSGKPWEKRVWRCNRYVKEGIKSCNNTSIPEKLLKEMFVKAFNKFQSNKEQYLKKLERSVKTTYNNKELNILFEESIEMLRQASNNRMVNIDEINKNTVIILQKKMQKLWKNIKFDELYYNNSKLRELLNKMPNRIKEFDEDIFKRTVEKIIALEPSIVQFHFINGAFIEEHYETKAVKERRKANGKKEYSGNSSQNN
ncbi:recombinase family protein [Clostridium botulinum]|uniref:recombinase family protein n=1 Tax=Clostridium botulinum TaxID=1491 RepID=UPI0006A3E510|nr:recombinase family protein [Clostridium botulinum]KOC32265.1 hypothetical protein ADU81_12195 [Clostridium botulinum]